jgi:hypothetical protein
MKEETGNIKMTVEAFFEALASNEEFIYAVAHTNSFKKDVKRCFKQNLDLKELYYIIEKLAKIEVLPPKKSCAFINQLWKREKRREIFGMSHFAGLVIDLGAKRE